MKHLKQYENKENLKYKIGDYVICSDHSHIRDEYKKYLENNIGRIKFIIEYDSDGEYNEYPYGVRYENVPSEFKSLFNDDDYKNCRWFSDEEILYNDTIENLETILAGKKYNI